MLTNIKIRNYKSVESLELSPGKLNVFIGENGCGKSNILEALAFSAAANSRKLDNEFLSNRGIRVTSPNLMCSNFKKSINEEEIPELDFIFDDSNKEHKIEIDLTFNGSKKDINFIILNESHYYSKWESKVKNNELADNLNKIYREKITEKFDKKNIDIKDIKDINTRKSTTNKLMKILEEVQSEVNYDIKSQKLKINDRSGEINNFIIYSPENTALRNYYKEGQVEPLSANGDGLLKLLHVINEKSPDKIERIKKSLGLFGWFDSIIIPKELNEKNDRLIISDRYTNISFDQQSANEGFLFVLFYISLIVSDDTPKIFAIDNVDSSLNPKLCRKLIAEIAKLAKEFGKQIFLTTHNPALLDGIDLTDEEQKLFVVSRRSQTGQTKIKRITADKRPMYENKQPMNLSDALLRGYLGGLPEGF